MSEQLTKDPMLSALHEVKAKLIGQRDEIGAAIIRKTCEEITKLERRIAELTESLRQQESQLRTALDELRAAVPPRVSQEEPTPRYQCFVAGCPANHASKREVCDTRPSEAIAVWLDAEGNFQWDFEINEDHPIDAAVVLAKRTNWVMTDVGWRLAPVTEGAQ